jgi:flagellar motor switch protein FliG
MAKHTGPEKAAILLMALGEEAASAVLNKLDDKEIQTLGNYMTYLGNVPSEDLDQISKEFYEQLQAGGIGMAVAGKDFIKNTLLRAMDPLKVAEIMDNIAMPGEETGGGLETIRLLDPKTIVNFLKNEHPQTAAIILAHLDPGQSGEVLKEMPEKIRTEVVYRMATLERIIPGVIKDLDEALQQEFSATGAGEGSKIGGVQAVAEMLNQIDHATESKILGDIEESDPELADSIRQLMFVFADLGKVDDRGIQAILKEVESEDLLLSLKTCAEPLKEKILKNMSERASMMIKEDLESMGPVRLSDVEKSQQKILKIAKKLEDEGKIVIGGGGEELV